MTVVNKSSLGKTVDAINEVFFFGNSFSKTDQRKTSAWLAGRQGQPGSYSGMFAPMAADFKTGVKLFTGEKITSSASVAHILGQETCRAMILMDDPRKVVRDALSAARQGMADRCLRDSESLGGMYCCGKCSVAMWRHLLVSGRPDTQRRLTAGLKSLKSYRDDTGHWRRFPFYYTLLALSEIDLPAVVREIRYAAPHCEKLLKRKPRDDHFDNRRRTIAERVLART